MVSSYVTPDAIGKNNIQPGFLCWGAKQHFVFTTTKKQISRIYVVVQFYPWFKFYFLLFQIHYHTLPYPKTEENKI